MQTNTHRINQSCSSLAQNHTESDTQNARESFRGLGNLPQSRRDSRLDSGFSATPQSLKFARIDRSTDFPDSNAQPPQGLEARQDAPSYSVTASKVLHFLTLAHRTRSRMARNTPESDSNSVHPEGSVSPPAVRGSQHHDLQNLRDSDCAVSAAAIRCFLESQLAAGPKFASEIIASAQRIGISRRALMDARADLHISSHVAIGPDNAPGWMWKLAGPAAAISSAPPASAQKTSDRFLRWPQGHACDGHLTRSVAP